MFGFHQKIAHINLTEKTTSVEKKDEEWYRIYAGGALLGTYFLLRDTPANLEAYDPRNLLIFASSIVAGNDGPGLARFSVVTKSPLSQGIGETQSEGAWGQSLKGSGYDALIFEGRSDQPVYILIENGEIKFFDASFIWGKDTNETTTLLEERHGKDDIRVAAIGQAGENLVRYASIISSRSNNAMRMGVGAVMGSKNIKAVVIKGLDLPEIYNIELLSEIHGEFKEKMQSNELSMWQKDAPGFSAWVDLSDDSTAYLGVNNFNENLFSAKDNFSRDNFLPYYKGYNPCPGCPNNCIKYLNPDPERLSNEVTGIHQEVTGTLGPNIGNQNLKLMLEANVACNLYGLDPVSLGFTISYAMESYENGNINAKDTNGIELSFGNEDIILPLIRDIAMRNGFGDILAEGTKKASEAIDNNTQDYALQVKGVEMVPVEPRSQTNLALGYATAPVGPKFTICEHDWDFDLEAGWGHTLENSMTLGILKRIPMDYVGPEKVKNYKALNNIWSACDTLNLSIFASAPTRVLTLGKIAELIHAITGWNTSSYEFMRWGERRNHLLRVYNIREGFTKEDDSLPSKFFNQPIQMGRFKGRTLDKDRFQKSIDTYYEMMGWDKDGVPLDGTLYDHQLDWTIPFIEDMEQ